MTTTEAAIYTPWDWVPNPNPNLTDHDYIASFMVLILVVFVVVHIWRAAFYSTYVKSQVNLPWFQIFLNAVRRGAAHGNGARGASSTSHSEGQTS